MPVSVFSLLLSFAKKEYQTESNLRANFWWFFMDQKKTLEQKSWARRVTSCPRGWGRAHPLGAPPASWLPRGPPDLFPTPTPLILPQTFRKNPRSGVPPLQASVATKNQSGPCFYTLPEGGSLTVGRLHHPGALHDEEGVIHPRGWGYVPVVMSLISLSLSLSRVLDLAWSWCIASFAIIVGSYDVSPP